MSDSEDDSKGGSQAGMDEMEKVLATKLGRYHFKDIEVSAFILEELRHAIVPGVDTINISKIWIKAHNKKPRPRKQFVMDVIRTTELIIGVLPEEVNKFYSYLVGRDTPLATWFAKEFRLSEDVILQRQTSPTDV